MASLQKILIAVDLSNFSMNALKKGLELAKEHHADVTVLHILNEKAEDKWWRSILPPLKQEIIQTKDQIASLLTRKISLLNKNKVHIKTVFLKSENPAITIVNYAKKQKVHLLIIGAHGDYTIHDWFVGTTAEYIAKKITCPVLICKKKNKPNYHRILLPIDFTKASEAAIDFATKYFPKAKIHVLHIADKAYESLIKNEYMQGYIKGKKLQLEVLRLLKANAEKMMRKFEKKGGKTFYKIKIGFPGIEILRTARQIRPSLIIMGTQGHTKKHYSWLGSIASHILIEIDNDILLVPCIKPHHKKQVTSEKKDFIKKINALTEERLQQLKAIAKKSV